MMQVPDFSDFIIIKTFNFPNLPKMIELEPMFGNDLTGHELNPCQNQTSNIMFFLLLQTQTSNYEKKPEIRMRKFSGLVHH